MTEHAKARAWREKRELTRARLAELTGYKVTAIYWFERGKTFNNGPTLKPIKPHVWLRYKRACAAVDAEIKGARRFNW